jgi:S1-C subfamily serine protease
MSSESNLTNPLIAFSEKSAEIVANVGNSLVAINRQRFSCSGIYWRDGLIVTSEESLKRTEEITITLPNGEITPVTLLGRDPSTDIAVLKTEASLPNAPVDKECELKVGYLALAVGRESERGLSVAQGVINNLSGSWRSSLGGHIDRFIRLDINFYPALGGSALVNAAGKVVGFNTTGPRRSVLTIPAATVERVVEQLLAKGHLHRGYLGVAMQPVILPDSLIEQISMETKRGLIVVSVEVDSPARQAGIILGDILVTIENSSIGRVRDIQAYLEPQNVGKTIQIGLIRGGKLKSVSLTVGDSGRS